MSPPDEKRFQKHEAALRARLSRAGSDAGGAPTRLDVDGQVIYEGERARAVTVFGERFELDASGVATVGGRRWLLSRIDGKDCLLPAD